VQDIHESSCVFREQELSFLRDLYELKEKYLIFLSIHTNLVKRDLSFLTKSLR